MGNSSVLAWETLIMTTANAPQHLNTRRSIRSVEPRGNVRDCLLIGSILTAAGKQGEQKT